MTRCSRIRFGAAQLLVATFAFVAAPAVAADGAQLGCPVEALSAGERENLADHVRRQGSPDEPAMQAFFRGVDSCVSRHGWSPGAAQHAIVYNLAAIGQREARVALERQGLDVARIEGALLADRTTIEAARGEGGPDAITAFYDSLDAGLRQRIESTDEGRSAELLGTYLMYRAVMETSRADFAAQ